jgi:hypothetical protein
MKRVKTLPMDVLVLGVATLINWMTITPVRAEDRLRVNTQPANAIRATAATLNGMVLSWTNPAVAWFEFGTGNSYAEAAGLTNVPVGNIVVMLRVTLEGLTPDHVYHYRLVASNLLGVVYGADQQFTLGANVAVWGNAAFGHTLVPADLTNAVAIGGGGDHCVALRNDGTVAAWGGNAYGQRDVPGGLSGVIAISAGQYHNLALLSDGTVRAWGAGTTLTTDFPEGGQSIVPTDLSNVVQIAAGTTHSMALKADGTVAAWGSGMGQAVVPVGLSNVVAISGGDFHNMALKADGTVVVWGDNTYGQASIPPGLDGVVAIKAGWYHNLALRADGTLAAWGYDAFGAVGGMRAGLSNVVGMAGGGFYSLAFQTNGRVMGSGDNRAGQCTIPINIQNATLDIAAGYDFGLALHRGGANLPPVAGTHYVDVNSPNPTPPYTNWNTAATAIQDVVDAAVAGDPILVTNGVYQTGGRAVAAAYATTVNRVAVDRAVSVQSVNGPQFTVIRGYQEPGTTNGSGAIRCVYLTNGSSLSGFTLTGGGTGVNQDAGGVWCQSTNVPVINCVLTGNSAYRFGGGAYQGTLNNCLLANNSANFGGAAYSSLLNHCTITGNSAQATGGVAGDSFGIRSELRNCVLTGNSETAASYSRLFNCDVIGNNASSLAGGTIYCTVLNTIVYYNRVGSDYQDNLGGTFGWSCTPSTPGVASNPRNITNAPIFIDLAAGNFRLASNSPCINSGHDAEVPPGPDLDGHPRIAGGTVDIGAYEFQAPDSIISYAWLQQYGLPTDGSIDNLDSDGDLMSNWQEWIAGTDPTNASSVLRLLSLTNDFSGLTVTWQSAAARTYFLERSTDLGSAPPFSLLQGSTRGGQPGTMSYTDTNAFGPGPFFYRVGVRR